MKRNYDIIVKLNAILSVLTHWRSGFLGNEVLSAGSHQVHISVGGDSMMARLLRKTVSAFNSSSTLNIQADNLGKLPSAPPTNEAMANEFQVLRHH